MDNTQPNPPQNVSWIYNPWLDLIVGCGAWSAPLLLLSYFSLSSSTRTWSIVFYVLAVFLNYPHYMATIYRAYHRAQDFQKYRIFTVHTTALIVLTLLLSHWWLRLLPWIFTIYLTWSPWHYSGQNYGLFMMFARRAGAQPSKLEQRALYGAFIVSYLALFLGFHTGRSMDPLFLSLGIPEVISRCEQAILACAFIALSAFGLWRLAAQTGWRKLIPSLTLFSSQFLWFQLPAAISLIKGIEVPQNRYSSGVLAVMHSAQYLWITSYYARREATGESARKPRQNWRPFAYFGVLILGGIALFVPGPWLASRAFHYDFAASFLIFTALVNIHHFILDGAIWKLRDGRIAGLLLSTRDHLSDSAAQAGGSLVSAGRWMIGNTLPARRLRLTAAVLLLLWGAVDQVRYYLALQNDDLRDLQRASALNSFDSSLQMRVAHRALEDGEKQQAEAAWRRAIQTNPADPAPRQALLQFLIGQDRFDEALALTDASLKYSPRDANLLVDRGLLAMRAGRADEAEANLTQALAIDPKQWLAQLYLAGQLDHEGKAQEAVAHYGAFLSGVSRQKPEERPAPDRVIAIVMRMADCQLRSGQADAGLKSYQLAKKLAAQTRQPKLESIADVNEADLQAKTGNTKEALQLYQHALQLDQTAGDDTVTAQDWASYGNFLDVYGYSPRLAFACLVKSSSLVNPPGNSVEDSLASAERRLENKLGSSAKTIRRNPDQALKEALSLR